MNNKTMNDIPISTDMMLMRWWEIIFNWNSEQYKTINIKEEMDGMDGIFRKEWERWIGKNRSNWKWKRIQNHSDLLPYSQYFLLYLLNDLVFSAAATVYYWTFTITMFHFISSAVAALFSSLKQFVFGLVSCICYFGSSSVIDDLAVYDQLFQ